MVSFLFYQRITKIKQKQQFCVTASLRNSGDKNRYINANPPGVSWIQAKSPGLPYGSLNLPNIKKKCFK